MTIREETIEKYLVRRIKEAGGECYKWVSPGRRGVPDRICIVSGHTPLFLELKRPKKEPTPAQFREGCRLTELGQTWDWASTKRHVDIILFAKFDFPLPAKTR